MNLSKNVYELCEMIMKQAKHVTVNYYEIKHYFCKDLKKTDPPKFPIQKSGDIYKDVLIELIGSSVNYCYWYGKSNIKPNNLGSTKMGELVNEATYSYDYIDKLIRLLTIHRFPLLEERIKHLNELTNSKAEEFCEYVIENKDEVSIDKLMLDLITTFPGFASDILLKRAILFFTQLYRKFGWFQDQMDYFFLPADYQIPKVLWHNNCITYSRELQNKIDNDELIPKGSIMEYEIRCASILAVREISKHSGWNICDIDTYLFLNRKEVSGSFHLTITTDY